MLNHTVTTSTPSTGTLDISEGSSSSTLPNNKGNDSNKMDNHQHHVHEFVSLYESLTENERWCQSKQQQQGVQQQRTQHRIKYQEQQQQDQLDVQPLQQLDVQQQQCHRLGIQQQNNVMKEERLQQHIDNLDFYNDDEKFESDDNDNDDNDDDDQVVVFNKYYYHHHIYDNSDDDDEIIFESIDEIDENEEEEIAIDIDNNTNRSCSSTSYDAGTGDCDQSLFSSIRNRMITKLIESEEDEEEKNATTTPLQSVEEGEETITDHNLLLPTSTSVAVKTVTREMIQQQQQHSASLMISPMESEEQQSQSFALQSTRTIVSFELDELVYDKNKRDDDDTNAALSASTISDNDCNRSCLSVPLSESPKNTTTNSSKNTTNNNKITNLRVQMTKSSSVSALLSSPKQNHRDMISKATMKKMKKNRNNNNNNNIINVEDNDNSNMNNINTENVDDNNNSNMKCVEKSYDEHINKKITSTTAVIATKTTTAVSGESNGTVTTSSITAEMTNTTSCCSSHTSMVESSYAYQNQSNFSHHLDDDDNNNNNFIDNRTNVVVDQSTKLISNNTTIIEITPRFTKVEMELCRFDPIISMSVSPQVYLDTMLHLRGYSTERYKALSSSYYNEPSILQECSYSQYVINKVNKNDIRTLRTLFTKYGLSINPCDYYGTSLIHYVCSIGNVDCLTMLFEIGCDIRIANCMGRTPLHEVCKPKRNIGCYNWLSNKTTKNEQQTKQQASSFCFEIMELIMKHDIRLFYIADQNGKLPLERISKQYWIHMKTFLDNVKDIYWPNRHFIKYGEEPSPPLTLMYPNTRILTNPKRIKFSSYIKKNNKSSYNEIIYNIANGKIPISEKNHDKVSSLSLSSRQHSVLCDESERSHSEACYSVTSDASSVMSYSGSVISSDDDDDIIGGGQRSINKIKSRTGNDIVVSPPKSERSTYGSYKGPNRNNSWKKAMNDSDHNRNHLLRHQNSWRRKQSMNIINRITNNGKRNDIGHDNHQSDSDHNQINKGDVNVSDHNNMNTTTTTTSRNPNGIPIMISIPVDRPTIKTSGQLLQTLQSKRKLQQQQLEQLGSESQGSSSSRKNRTSQRSFYVECFDNL